MSMYKKLGIIALIIIILVFLTVTVFGFSYTQQRMEELKVEEETNSTSIHNLTLKQGALHNLANVLRETAPNRHEELLNTLGDEWLQAQDEKNILSERNEIITEELTNLQQQHDNEKKWIEKEQEYPAATYIWKFLKEQGYNDYVCAGIMGNIMSEVGGHTLNLNWSASGNGYYGICQWNKAYSDIWGANLETQCNYLIKTIKYEFDTFGFNYYKGFNYNAFLSMTSCKDAAIAFAKCYERCSSVHYSKRQDNAVKAYNYFVN